VTLTPASRLVSSYISCTSDGWSYDEWCSSGCGATTAVEEILVESRVCAPVVELESDVLCYSGLSCLLDGDVELCEEELLGWDVVLVNDTLCRYDDIYQYVTGCSTFQTWDGVPIRTVRNVSPAAFASWVKRRRASRRQ